MRTQRGWCLLEVLVVVITGAAVAGTAASLVERQAQASRTMASYGHGLRQLRGVLDEVADDVRAGRDVSKTWRMEGDKLFRAGRLRATHVAGFEAKPDAGITTIRISPMSRTRGATKAPTATLTLRVSKRGGS